MNSRLRRLLLKCFPSEWRAEYGPEFEDLLSRESLTIPEVADIFWSACKQWARRPVFRFSFALVITAIVLFAAGVAIAEPMWRALSSPAVSVLRQHRFRPPALVSDTPYETLAVIWFGIPLLFAVFTLYPFLLAYISTLLLNRWEGQKQLWIKSCSFYSAMVFIASVVSGLALWRGGWPVELLLAHGSASPSAPTNSTLSIQGFFFLVAISFFVWVSAWQAPVLILFRWRWNVRRAAAAHD